MRTFFLGLVAAVCLIAGGFALGHHQRQQTQQEFAMGQAKYDSGQTTLARRLDSTNRSLDTLAQASKDDSVKLMRLGKRLPELLRERDSLDRAVKIVPSASGRTVTVATANDANGVQVPAQVGQALLSLQLSNRSVVDSLDRYRDQADRTLASERNLRVAAEQRHETEHELRVAAENRVAALSVPIEPPNWRDKLRAGAGAIGGAALGATVGALIHGPTGASIGAAAGAGLGVLISLG